MRVLGEETIQQVTCGRVVVLLELYFLVTNVMKEHLLVLAVKGRYSR